jgi:membrane-associated protease RseP (regulator of RpoE activity)
VGYAVGIALFAVGILVSLSLHEVGHLGTAKAFGMRASRFFIGYGPTLWSFRRGETEYGLKAVPVGAFVRVDGMTPEDDDTAPAERHRAMWRFPVWKRTVVLGTGPAVHFVLGFAILWGVFAFAPLNDYARTDEATPRVSTVAPCVTLEWTVDPDTGAVRECVPGADPASPAARAGLRPGDVIVAVDGRPVAEWAQLTARLREAGGTTITLTYERAGESRTAQVAVPLAERVRAGVPRDTPLTEISQADLERVGVLGITQEIPRTTYGPVRAVGMAADQTGSILTGTVQALGRLPERVPLLVEAVFGGERDPQTPVSLVGASRLGGELWDRGELPGFLVLLAAFNFFTGVFNLLPVLPLDGGQLTIAWFGRARGWLYARLGRPDPGPVSYDRLMPLTSVVVLVMAGFFLLTVAADIVNPIRL